MEIFESAAARTVRWNGGEERLDRAVAECGLASSRSRAAELVRAGAVLVDGAVQVKPAARVASGASITVTAAERYVSAGALKLLAALDEFGIDPAGRLALDVGASTGGFTQVLLESGAARVQAVDVGHGQMATSLREHPRVRLAEGVNARDLTPEMLARVTGEAEMPSLLVTDVSFISLTLLLPVFREIVAPGAELVLLVKPQFEQGRAHGGVVSSPEKWAAAVTGVLECAEQQGFGVCGLTVSPVLGGEGNREFLAYLVAPGEPVDNFLAGSGSSRHNRVEWRDMLPGLCEGKR